MNLAQLSQNYRIILGSASPRRGQLLSDLGLAFEIIVPQITEAQQAGESPLDYVRRNSQLKALEVLNQVSQGAQVPPLVISADTIVELDGVVLEKPRSDDEARDMLKRLSGQSHLVRTGFCVASVKPGESERLHEEIVTTTVEFRKLTPTVINSYLQTGEPFDKAGAYGIQGQAAVFVRRIEGSYTNVVGLPLVELWEALEAFLSA
jgi:septum formation protein